MPRTSTVFNQDLTPEQYNTNFLIAELNHAMTQRLENPPKSPITFFNDDEKIINKSISLAKALQSVFDDNGYDTFKLNADTMSVDVAK